MTVTRQFNLFLNDGSGSSLVIHSNQFESDENWVFTLYDETGSKYIPTAAEVIGQKSDRNIIVRSCTVNGSGQVVMAVGGQLTTAAGTSEFELVLSGHKRTANFIVDFEPSPITSMGLVSEADLSAVYRAVDMALDTEEVNILKNRVDNLAHLTDGSTTGDAELIDIRVGANGTTYSSAGNAVRGQVADLNQALTAIGDIKNLFDKNDVLTGKRVKPGSGNTYDTLEDSTIYNASNLIHVELGKNYIVNQPLDGNNSSVIYCYTDAGYYSQQLVGVNQSNGTVLFSGVPNSLIRFSFGNAVDIDNLLFINADNITGQEYDALMINIKASENNLLNTIENTNKMLTGIYDPTSTYSIGDSCIYNDELYVCIVDISTPENWTISHWAKTNIMKEFLISKGVDFVTQYSLFNGLSFSSGVGIADTGAPVGYSWGGSIFSLPVNPGDVIAYNLRARDTNLLFAFYTASPASASTFIANSGKLGTGIINYVSGVVVAPENAHFMAISTANTVENEYCFTMLKATNSLLTQVMKSECDDKNTYYGKGAMTNISGNAQSNVAVGYNALNKAQNNGNDANEGSWNTAVGYNALSENTTGNHNTAVGFCSQRDMDTGTFNTSIGEDSMLHSTDGTGNVAVGTYSAKDMTTGTRNIVIGFNSGRDLQAGGSNILIGPYAGILFPGDSTVISKSVKDDNRLILIGQFVGKDTTETLSNSIGIGASVDKSNQVVLGNANIAEVVLGGKKLAFNNDGTVTWEPVNL